MDGLRMMRRQDLDRGLDQFRGLLMPAHHVSSLTAQEDRAECSQHDADDAE
jgi:hypothetical protein